MSNKEDLRNTIREHVDEVRNAYENGTIEDLRNIDSENYEIVEIEFPFGMRRCAIKKSQNSYLMLQKSRGGSVRLESDITVDENLDFAKSQLDIIPEIDKIRIDEIKIHIDKNIISLPESAGFAELGFRCAKLLKYYSENMGMNSTGFDVISSNIAVAKCLGYNAEIYDFNNCEKDLNIKEKDLVISYHMLEHVTNPLTAVKKIYDSMKYGSYFHVEIPIEPNGPNIRYCHMYSFHPADMFHMLTIAGFKVLTASNKVQENGPTIERYMALKEEAKV